MVNYGSGQLGDVTVSANTTKKNPILEYTNLTVEDGVTLTLPSRSRLMVTGTLTVNGVIRVQNDIAGSGAGGAKSGGNLELFAKEITGTGEIDVDGATGGDGNSFGNQNNGGSGAGYSIPATGKTGSGGSGGGKGSDAYYDGNSWNGNRNGGGGGNAHSSIYNDSTLKAYIEDYLISGAYITQSPIDTLLPGSGGGAGGGGSEQLRRYSNNNNSNYRDRIEVGGGGGGAGGSFITKGGAAGNGDEHYENDNALSVEPNGNNNGSASVNYQGGEGGGGGGAGGFILLVSESVSLDVTFSVRGGDGGDGYWGRRSGNEWDGNSFSNFNEERNDMDGGGGGGGSGGLIIGFTDKTPTIDLSGGNPGIPGGQRRNGANNNANAGKVGEDGATFLYDVTELV
ncbi:putative adhesin [Haloarcula virus HJTV-2]|uniref:Adhesin n=1 Tax=Haloarcula virus HJTV-2 TaxID=2877986 RepID=A0AAE9BX75_9CAUD|nr:putative adhesin [Haloarcula virus HJTV-2]UBF21653.1 putative adhesin [Haloarcula virus HJTV-2]